MKLKEKKVEALLDGLKKDYDEIDTEEPQSVDYKQKIDELNELLEKEKQKSLRLLADYQNLEKQTIDRINARENKIILDFLTVYEDFIRAKTHMKKKEET